MYNEKLQDVTQQLNVRVIKELYFKTFLTNKIKMENTWFFYYHIILLGCIVCL